ncbi:MAG: hypothetical protein EA353_01175 [Puniceicoccaceae bacterium]|nr:MAG: hypothetical protein EA353_01175 [Puniceicoccaceae bacterium]
MHPFTFAHRAKASILNNMSPLKIFLLALLTLFFWVPAHALRIEAGAINNSAIFGIQFPKETRAFYAKESSLQSISVQDYLTANFRVTELNVVNQGSALLRIYHSRPLLPGELQQAMADGAQATGAPGGASSIIQRPLPPQVQALADRAAGVSEAITSTEVMKEYPVATHAHTIEFRIGSLKELLNLHDELQKHWTQEPDTSGDEPEARRLGGTLFTVE